ncbi:MAG: hypothetical protein HC855_11660 [Rhizobiales bacterium]|nr:hypothetical protein [Hyphomicrobiales bacterium]
MSRDKIGQALKSVKGRVERKLVSKGSKSEREAIVLVTDEGEEFLLRRRGGNPFTDAALDKLVGKVITLKGTLLQKLLLMDEWKEDKPEK